MRTPGVSYARRNFPRQLLRGARGLVGSLGFWDGHTLRDERRLDHGSLLRLGGILAFTAGALNAGGFQALGFYTSHVTGNTSKTANELALGHLAGAVSFGILVPTFMAGAFLSGMLLSYGRRHRYRARHAFSMTMEAGLICLFGLFGDALSRESFFAPATAVLLSFVMGMHNAVSSSMSRTEVRTTHMTGNATDLGLELSQLLYANRAQARKMAPVRADRRRLSLHAVLVACFFAGALSGALAFARYGYVCALPLAGVLLLLSFPPLALDLEARLRLREKMAG
ncbi:MAG TPA: YoaK family protein [bacterium]|jgi:uncharacterized membrane protein YoaK (UPF0700 family)|nr:YoaK family protein [bacterium]